MVERHPRPSISRVFERFIQARVVQGHERKALEPRDENSRPDPAHGDERKRAQGDLDPGESRGLAGSDEAGITSQTRSTQCMTRIKSDTRKSDRGCRLFSRIKSRKNGRKNWQTIKREANPLPAAARPAKIPGNLLPSSSRSRRSGTGRMTCRPTT